MKEKIQMNLRNLNNKETYDIARCTAEDIALVPVTFLYWVSFSVSFFRIKHEFFFKNCETEILSKTIYSSKSINP